MSPRKPFRPDSKQTNELLKAGRAAAIGARRDSRQQGLVVTFIKGNAIYEEHPDGTEVRVGTVDGDGQAQIHVTKGTVLRAR